MSIMKKMTAALSSLVLAASVFAVPEMSFAKTTVWAENTAELSTTFLETEKDLYLADPSNILWESEEFRCYKDGNFYRLLSGTFYYVVLKHDTDTVLTSELLGLSDEYGVGTGRGEYLTNYVEVEDGELSAITGIRGYEKATEVGKLAQSWYDEGLITDAAIMAVNEYECADLVAGFEIIYNDPENVITDFEEFGITADRIVERSDGTLYFDYSKEDYEIYGDILNKLEADSRVKEVFVNGTSCCTVHRYKDFEPVLVLDTQEESSTSFTMTGDDAYYSDPTNVAWAMDNFKCYKNGMIIKPTTLGYCVLLQHKKDTAISSYILGLPDGYLLRNDTLSYLEPTEDNELSMIMTKTYEEACEISKLANAWLEEGLVSKASILTTTSYGCSDGLSVYVGLKNPEDTIDFSAYGLSEERVYEVEEGIYGYALTKEEFMDYATIETMRLTLENDEKVLSASVGTSFCEVFHMYRTFAPIYPVETPTYTLEELYEMSNEEFFALAGAEEMYSHIQYDVNSVEGYSDLMFYGGISGRLSAEYADYSANVTEQSIEALLGDTVNYYINSPINIEVDDLFYEYRFDVFFTDMNKDVISDGITEEDIMKMAKCYYCVNQVIDVHYWEYHSIGEPAPGDEPILTGDANFNKSVDVYDIIWISNYIIENYKFTDAQKVISDVNDDGFVDVGDAVKVAMYVLNPEANPLG